MAHIFIVNEQTFKMHLEYLFAGTGASDTSTDFIFDNSIKLSTAEEKKSIGMMTDVARIRKGDKIIFFVTGISKFYGIFEASSDFFLDPNDKDNYLHKELGKILTYRLLIKPYKVYKNGLSEFDALDSLQNIKYPDEICWSLIYRKLGGNRGCTMITDQEYDTLLEKLKKNNQLIKSKDTNKQQITPNTHHNIYKGRHLDVIKKLKDNMFYKYRTKKAFEHYLQFWIITILKSKKYNKILSPKQPVSWIGNEVMCSFGERRIDIMTIQKMKKQIDISLIELKDEKVKQIIIEQLSGYIRWILNYILPIYLRNGYKINIHPIIISEGISNLSKRKDNLDKIEQEIKSHSWSLYNSSKIKVLPTKIIHFQPDKETLQLTNN